MSRGRKVALAIGVSHAPPLPFLGAAVAGARGFHEWARELGYEAHLVTDEPDPVTCERDPVTAARLRRELEELLPAAGDDGARIERLLIYFAGHGLIREVEQGLWLLSDWYQELRAVGVENLKRRLSKYYRVEQIGLFADACRSLPRSIDTDDLTPDALLGSGVKSGKLAESRQDVAAVDKFIATQDGAQTFMIPGSDPDEDRCLFSGVLMEALWGTQPGAYAKYRDGKVTSQSLGAYLTAEVPRRARVYGLTVNPSVSPTFPEDFDVYFGDDPEVKPRALAPWPSAEQFQERNPQGPPVQFRGPTRGLPRADSRVKDQLRGLGHPFSPLTRCGFTVNGAAVDRVWAIRDVSAGLDPSGWWEVSPRGGWSRPETTRTWTAPVLVELADGSFASVTALTDFLATVAATDRGVAGLVYRKRNAPPSASRAAEDAIGLLERRALRADDALDLAVELRYGKHADPVLGVISAYLYDSVGDLENIRRMAYYYISRGQLIPYDIALLAQLRGEKRNDGLLTATVPAVRAREPRTEREIRASWTFAQTPPATGVVGGLWPWLRQGWAFLDDPAADGSTLVLPGLIELAEELMPARFTTLRPEAGRRLADQFSLRPSMPRPWRGR